MKPLTKVIWILPLLALVLELSINLFTQTKPKISPISKKNDQLDQIIKLITSTKIKPLKVTLDNSSNEIEFEVKDTPIHNYKVIISNTKNIITQVNALQKLIKIANIKGKEIQFIDLGSARPYATL